MNKMINSISLGKTVMPLGYEILTEFINLKLQNSEIYVKQDGISSTNTSWCFDRLIIDCLVQNQPKTYTLGFNFFSRIHGEIHEAQYYMLLCLVIFRQEKRLKPFRFKPFRFIFRYIRSYKSRYLVDVAGVEPASASITLENTTCLDIVYYFNPL